MRRLLLLPFAMVILLCLSYPALAAETYTDNLARARAAMASGDTDTALSIYGRLLDENPDDTELRLEAARAHYAAGDEYEALRLGRQVMNDYEKNRFILQGAIRMGVTYSSNVNQGTGSNNIRLGDWNVQLSDAKGISSGGTYIGANAEMAYRMSAAGPWWWVGDAGVLWRGYFNSELSDINNSHSTWGRVAGGLRYMQGRDLLDMRLKAEIYDYEFNSNVTALGGELQYIRFVTPHFHVITDMGAERRNYSKYGDRDGSFGRIGAYGRFIFGGAGHELLAGGSFFGASADIDRYEYTGWQAMARVNFLLSNNLTVSPQALFTRTSHDGPGTALETEDRRDKRFRVGVDLSYVLNSDWSVEVGYHYTHTDSTSELYEYTQHEVSLGAVWKF